MNFVDKQTLQCWAEGAVRGYLDDNIPLSDGIKKIASENALNGEQVKRLVEFANINTNLELFEKCADKRFTFKQAKIEEIIDVDSSKQEEGDPSGLSDYMSPPVKESSVEKNASENNQTAEIDEADLFDYMEKTAQAIKELEQEKLSSEMEIDDLENALYEEVKQQVLSDNHSFKEVCAYALECKQDLCEQKIIKEALLKAAYKLCEDDYTINKVEVKKLASAAPIEYISDSLDMPGTPVMIRNGNTNMYYIIDTLVKQKERISNYDKPLLHLNNNLRYVKRKLLNC